MTDLAVPFFFAPPRFDPPWPGVIAVHEARRVLRNVTSERGPLRRKAVRSADADSGCRAARRAAGRRTARRRTRARSTDCLAVVGVHVGGGTCALRQLAHSRGLSPWLADAGARFKSR
jgi:hypothetical protein